MLGLNLGLGLNNNKYIRYIGPLDDLHISNDAVFIFSPYKRLVNSYTGNLVKVQRTSDNESQWFGYDSNGDLDTSSLLEFCGNSDGLVDEISNQFNSSYNAVQTTQGYKPKIVSSGVLETNGLLFDGTDDFMNVEKYSDINILDHPFSIFAQGTNNSVSTGYYLGLNDDGSDSTYALYTTTSPQVLNFKLNTTTCTLAYTAEIQENILCSYDDGGTSAQKIRSNSGTGSTNNSSTLNEHSFFNIGCRSTAVDNSTHSYFFNGYIKTIIIFNTNQSDNYSNLVNKL